jgi:hypothetical protein
LCDYKVWIDTERGEEVKHHLHNIVKLNLMRRSSMPVRWRRVDVPLTLPCSVRWIMRSIKRSESRRGHVSMRKHNVRRKRMTKVVRKHS